MAAGLLAMIWAPRLSCTSIVMSRLGEGEAGVAVMVVTPPLVLKVKKSTSVVRSIRPTWFTAPVDGFTASCAAEVVVLPTSSGM